VTNSTAKPSSAGSFTSCAPAVTGAARPAAHTGPQLHILNAVHQPPPRPASPTAAKKSSTCPRRDNEALRLLSPLETRAELVLFALANGLIGAA
jgi:hypothetical protein